MSYLFMRFSAKRQAGPVGSGLLASCSERYTDAYAEVVEVVYRIGQDIAAVGGVAVVKRHVETEAVVRTREDANADFGREVESPRVGVLLDYVVIGREFCIVGAQLQTRIGLEYAVRKPCVASRDAERQLERAVFLIDGQGRAVAQIERLARNARKVGLVGDEGTYGDRRSSCPIPTPCRHRRCPAARLPASRR